MLPRVWESRSYERPQSKNKYSVYDRTLGNSTLNAIYSAACPRQTTSIYLQSGPRIPSSSLASEHARGIMLLLLLKVREFVRSTVQHRKHNRALGNSTSMPLLGLPYRKDTFFLFYQRAKNHTNKNHTRRFWSRTVTCNLHAALHVSDVRCIVCGKMVLLLIVSLCILLKSHL